MSFEFYGLGYLPLELSKQKIPTYITDTTKYNFGGNVDFFFKHHPTDDFHGI